MQFSSAGKPPLGIVYDSDFGMSAESVLALALLRGFAGKNISRLVGISISSPNLKAAQLCDVVEKYYASATTGMAAMFFQGPPLGLAEKGKTADSPLMKAVLDLKDPDGKHIYESRIADINDTAVGQVVIRNMLMAQHAGNAAIVSAGPATNLAKLLMLRGAADLIQDKVKFLVLTGGDYPKGKSETNFTADIDAIRKVLADWPTPIIIAGRELGKALPYPAESFEKDFSYAPHHPVADACRVAGSSDIPAAALAAALYANQADAGYFKLSDTGTLSISEDGASTFQPSGDGKHRFLLFDPEKKQQIIEKYREMVSAKPVPRMLRRPPQQNADPPKPDPAKPPTAEKKS